MSKCPRCFVSLTSDHFAWTQASGTTTEADPVASAYHGGQVLSRKIIELRRPVDAHAGWAPPPQHAELELGGPVREVCPTCHYVLVDGWRNAQVTCIAMAGARATGKTVYIAVLIKQLQLLGESWGAVVEPFDSTTEATYRDHYETPLYEARGILEATPAAHTGNPYQREPLIFSLGHWNNVSQILVIRDVAGEDLENPENARAPWLQFFAHADGVLFMFDPLKVESVTNQLHDLVPTQERVGGDPRTVLRTVLGIIGLGTPNLAIILSKFDALQSLQSVEGSDWSRIMSNPGAAFSRDFSLRSAPYHDGDGQLLNQEVRSLLKKLDATPMVMSVDQPHTGRPLPNRYFAVSALGESPVGDRLHASGITPFRCLDPVRWVLATRSVWHWQ
ncbi:hypothetical protein C7T36_16255 [Rhodococcus sp. AD45-ID]|uniref:Double-GTPase 2 domain-containing protein n=1 Tax=Nocardia globerula TaxID=1818 RepID=A0A652YIT2_NOCGL|nr:MULTISPECIES: hypothetical protein [Rhodococcus]KJF19583.1 hypothetical protein SZ00_06007 [Rhodococcus sp. AD45]NMD63973.1 hypothetical protein [Nocardia globerula]PSR39289.1 hypothetical protein C7T36_16255 [Rhodococcus sp. AD45-ID]PVX66766.1 hypothetical protein C8E04_4107 [Rhodococcus globerulus]